MEFPLRSFAVFTWAGVLYLIGEFLSNPQLLGFCKVRPYQSDICLASTTLLIGWPLIAAGQIFAIVGVIMFFANAKAWRWWLIFSLCYVPIATYLAVTTTTGSLMFGPEQHLTEFLTWVFGILYILITLAIVLLAKWQDSKSPTV